MDSVARDPDAAPENTGGLHLMAIKEQPSQNWDNLRNAQKKGEIADLSTFFALGFRTKYWSESVDMSFPVHRRTKISLTRSDKRF
jgi:hypothetical protein